MLLDMSNNYETSNVVFVAFSASKIFFYLTIDIFLIHIQIQNVLQLNKSYYILCILKRKLILILFIEKSSI